MYRTGQTAPYTTTYAFVRYVDGSILPAPTAAERVIRLTAGDPFPPIASCKKDAWWRIA